MKLLNNKIFYFTVLLGKMIMGMGISFQMEYNWEKTHTILFV